MLSHWVWFAVPHVSLGYILLRDPDRFPSAAARMYTVFDVGAVFYWAIPTAPPWWAAQRGYLEERRRPIEVRRMMIEYGPQFWGDCWPPLYDLLGGNPLAAMPSLHFATSLMAAHLLAETGPVAGAVGSLYAGTLGLALVYLGEHYAADLLAGAALTETVRLAGSARAAAREALAAACSGRSRLGRTVPRRRRESHPGEQLLRLRLTRGRLIGWGLFVLATLAFLYFVLPRIVGLHETWNRLRQGNVWWLALAFALEVGSFLGYITLFRAVFARGRGSIGWRASYEITMAGVAATRLFASAGRRRDRAHGVGAPARRDVAAGRGVAADRVHGPALRRLHGGAGARRRRFVHRDRPRRRAVRDHDGAGDLRRAW